MMKQQLIRILLTILMAWPITDKKIYCASYEFHSFGKPLTIIPEIDEKEDYLDTIKSIDIVELLRKPIELQIRFFSDIAIPANLYDPTFYEHPVFQLFLKQLEKIIEEAPKPNLPLHSLCLVLKATFLAISLYDREQKEDLQEEAKKWEIWSDYLIQTDT